MYAKDNRSPLKQKAASRWIEALIATERLVLSAQSLREFYAVSLRNDRSETAKRLARDNVAELLLFVPEGLRPDRLDDAWALQDRHQLSFWDALLIASACFADCTIFLSEDLNSGQQIASLTIVNPFTTSPDAVLGAV